nr:hypothetical protein [Desulfobacteraceae bacterium]
MLMPQLETMLDQIEHDLLSINHTFNILSLEQLHMLHRDMKYVFLDNIAEMIRLVFYDPKSNTIYWEYIYSKDGNAQVKGDMQHDMVSDDLIFDVFIDFTKTFLCLHRDERQLLLNNTELDWFT